MRRTIRLKSIRVPLGAVSMIIVAGVNLSMVLTKLLEGGDPFGYANAALVAGLWAFAMLWETDLSEKTGSGGQTDQ